MDIGAKIALALVPPGVVAFAVAWFFLRARKSGLSRGGGPTPGPAPLWPAGLVLTGAAVATYILALGWPTWPPVAMDHRLGWLFIALVVIVTVKAMINNPRDTVPYIALLAIGVPVVALYPRLVNFWGWPWHESLFSAGTAAGIVISGLSLSAIESRGGRASAAFILAGLAMAIGGALAGSGSISLGQLAWSLALPALGLTIIVALRPAARVGSAAIFAAISILGACVLAGLYTSNLTRATALLLPAAPLASLLADLFIAPMLKPKLATAARILPAAVIAGIAMALSIQLPEENPY